MAIELNGVTFSDGGSATFNNTALTSIKFDATEVWRADTELWLYEEGNSFTANTGGWVQRLVNTVSGAYAQTPVNYDGHVTITCHTRAVSGSNSAAQAYTANMINVSGFSTLHFRAWSSGLNNTSSFNTGVAMGFIGLFDRTDPAITTGSGAGVGVIAWKQISNYGNWVDTTFDISGVTGSYYIGAVQRAGDASFRNLWVSKMWLD